MTDMVNAPDHYRGHASGVECIEITENMPFSAGNSLKYVFRRNDKWNTLEDCRKALWYLRRHIERGLESVWLSDFESVVGRGSLLKVITHEPASDVRIFYSSLLSNDPLSALEALEREIARLEAIAS